MVKIIFKVGIGVLFFTLIITGCKEQKSSDIEEKVDNRKALVLAAPLPSWNDNPAKKAIIKFVRDASDKDNPGYIPVSERIAVFDNDGTLWPEKPMYFQYMFAIDRVKQMAKDHPEWKEQQPFKSIIENDLETLSHISREEIFEVLMVTHSGVTPLEYTNTVLDWMSARTHPFKDKLLPELVYQPMIELVEFLRYNEFQSYIITGNSIEFMRAWVEEVFGIAPSRIIGSYLKTEMIVKDGKPKIMLRPEIEFVNSGKGKPVAIERFIGKVPVFAVGNADGDLEMLQYSAIRSPSFQMFIHHTDSLREWAYDRHSKIGRFDKAWDEAEARYWTIVDMAEDWKVIYSFEMTAEQQ